MVPPIQPTQLAWGLRDTNQVCLHMKRSDMCVQNYIRKHNNGNMSPTGCHVTCHSWMRMQTSAFRWPCPSLCMGSCRTCSQPNLHQDGTTVDHQELDLPCTVPSHGYECMYVLEEGVGQVDEIGGWWNVSVDSATFLQCRLAEEWMCMKHCLSCVECWCVCVLM